MKNKKITAYSAFHGGLQQSFIVPLEAGRYPRRCKLACDGKRDSRTGIQVECGCGFPCHRTSWDGVPDDFIIHAEWNDVYPVCRENIVIVVEPNYRIM